MSARRSIWEIARRELVERSRARAMRVSFAILLAFVVAGAVAATLSGQGTPTDDFGVAGPRAVALAPALRMAGQADGRKARIHRLRDRVAAERAVRDGDVDVAIVGDRLLVKESRSTAPVGVARRAVAGLAAVQRLEAAGLTRQQALATVVPRTPRVDVLDPGARARERNTGMLWIGVLILFFSFMMYGQSVASSVTGEKSSRVIELLLTTLSPRRLLAGKVLGVGAARGRAARRGLRGRADQRASHRRRRAAAERHGDRRAGGRLVRPRLRLLQRRLCRARRARVAAGGPGRDDRAGQRAPHRRLLRGERRHPGPRRDLGADRRLLPTPVADDRPDSRRARRHGRARASSPPWRSSCSRPCS